MPSFKLKRFQHYVFFVGLYPKEMS